MPGFDPASLQDPAAQVPPDPSLQAQNPDLSGQVQGPPQQQPPQQAPDQGPPEPPQMPKPQGGIIKSLLTNFFQGAGDSMLKHVGLPTPYEQAQSEYHNKLLGYNAQQISQQKQALNALAYARTGQVEGANQTRLAAAQLAANPRMAAIGLNPDGSPMTDEQMSPLQRSKVAYTKAATDVADARASLEEAKNDPNSPLFKQKLLEYQDKLRILNANLGLRERTVAQGDARVAQGAQRTDALYGGQDVPDGVDPNKYVRLSPGAQKTLQETTPVHAQIQDLISQFDSMKDDNTPMKFFGQRALYSAGIQSPIGQAADTIAQLELNRIVGAARVLKGGSRAIQALNMAMVHMPNVWIDSPKMIRSKLQNLDKALTQIEQSAYSYGSKSGLTPEGPNGAAPVSQPQAAPPVPQQTSSGFRVGQKVLIKGNPATITAVHDDGTYDAQ